MYVRVLRYVGNEQSQMRERIHFECSSTAAPRARHVPADKASGIRVVPSVRPEQLHSKPGPAAFHRHPFFSLFCAKLLKMATGSIQLNQPVPDFDCTTTHGPMNFFQYKKDKWCVLFSHPADFTPGAWHISICLLHLLMIGSLHHGVHRVRQALGMVRVEQRRTSGLLC